MPTITTTYEQKTRTELPFAIKGKLDVNSFNELLYAEDFGDHVADMFSERNMLTTLIDKSGLGWLEKTSPLFHIVEFRADDVEVTVASFTGSGSAPIVTVTNDANGKVHNCINKNDVLWCQQMDSHYLVTGNTTVGGSTTAIPITEITASNSTTITLANVLAAGHTLYKIGNAVPNDDEPDHTTQNYMEWREMSEGYNCLQLFEDWLGADELNKNWKGVLTGLNPLVRQALYMIQKHKDNIERTLIIGKYLWDPTNKRMMTRGLLNHTGMQKMTKPYNEFGIGDFEEFACDYINKFNQKPTLDCLCNKKAILKLDELARAASWTISPWIKDEEFGFRIRTFETGQVNLILRESYILNQMYKQDAKFIMLDMSKIGVGHMCERYKYQRGTQPTESHQYRERIYSYAGLHLENPECHSTLTLTRAN